MKKTIIDVDLIKQYLNNYTVDAVTYNGNSIENLTIEGEELWTASPFKFTLLDDGTYGVSAKSITSIFGDVNIPSEYEGVAVTSIGNNAFYGCSGLTSITIPDSVTSIGEAAFSGCSSLESITLPFTGASPRSKGLFGHIFGTSSYTGSTATKQYDNTGASTIYYIPTILKTVTMTSSYIAYRAFYNCSTITNITLGDSVVYIDQEAFKGCTSLTSVVIPDSMVEIKTAAFNGCALTDVYYMGTEEQWSRIRVGLFNDKLTKATIHYNWANT